MKFKRTIDRSIDVSFRANFDVECFYGIESSPCLHEFLLINSIVPGVP